MSTVVEMTYWEALHEALREALRTDERVVLLGEDLDSRAQRPAVSVGLLEEFGPERVRPTPLSDAALVGTGVGAALEGLRPVVQVTTADFGRLALAQAMAAAASLLHRSGGQYAVPLVVRVTASPHRRTAPHPPALEAWYAHLPGLRIVAPATPADARGMLATALADPDPVVIVEHGRLLDLRGPLRLDAGPVDIDRAAVRRQGDDVTLVTYGGMLPPTLEAAAVLADEGVSTEVVDLRTLRPLDEATVVESVRRTHRVVVVDDAWRSGSLAAEVAARVQERAFHDLDAPVERVCSAEVPIPYAPHLEAAALPRVATIVAAARRTGE